MSFRKRLEQDGALLHGHFVYLSGNHALTYVNKTVAFVRGSNVQAFAAAVVDEFVGDGIEVLVAPELGALTFAAHIQAEFLRRGQDVFLVVATKVRAPHPDPEIAKDGYVKDIGAFEIVRDQGRFLEGKRVLVIEDIFSTGSTVVNVLPPVREHGGNPVAVALLWNQGGVTPEKVGIGRIHALISDRNVQHPFLECPACEAGTPMNTKVGKGGAFLRTDRAVSLGLKAAD